MTPESSSASLAAIVPGSLDAPVTFHPEANGSTRASLVIDGAQVSWLWIVPLTIRIGTATVRMDGIAGVGTADECRHRGYDRRVLEATVAWMQQGEAPLSMLYGIPHFYPKFGYSTAGPDQFIALTRLTAARDLPTGWQSRPFAPADLAAVRDLYEQNTAEGVGCAVRSLEAEPWRKLASPDREANDCRVVVDREGKVRAYAWRAQWHWYMGSIEREHPDALVIGEVMAEDPTAADAVLATCRAWAAEESAKGPAPVKQVVLALPPEGHVAAAARFQSARFIHHYDPCGASMARVLNVERLLEAMRPELARRLQAAGSPLVGSLHLQTEIGAAILTLTPDTVQVDDPNQRGHPLAGQSPPAARPDERAEPIRVSLPQPTLARLALGAFPPGDLLARLEPPLDVTARRLLEALFPQRHPHMYLPDRF